MKAINPPILLFFLHFIFLNCSPATEFQLKEGDILFQDSDCGPFCDAIEAVTQGIDHYNFSHVGLVMKDSNNQLKVMEAISKGVVLTPLDSFLQRSFDTENRPKVIVGRLNKQYTPLIPEAIVFIHSKMDAQYDAVFDINNDKYYCSELIHLAFQSANNNTPIFTEQPMTYKSPNTNQTFPIWKAYFKALNTEIPEGKPGLNPGGMSRSKYITIVHRYGEPSKQHPK